MADPKIKGSTNENLGKISVNIEPDEPKNFSPKLGDIKDKALNLSRFSEQGIVNEKTGASVVIRDDGQINLASSKYAQVKVSPNGRLSSTSMESITITNRRKVNSDEVAINEHKMNPQLWELADFRKAKLTFNPNAIVGNLCMFGSVLVKAWDPLLKRYMLIRRPWLGPVFGPLMNVPEINAAIKVNDPMDFSEDILALSDKGYQVNAAIQDPDSMIGKPGKDRPGIIRSGDALTAAGADGAGASANTPMASNLSAEQKKKIFDYFVKAGYTPIAACGIMGRLEQEHHWQTDFVELHNSSIGTCGGLGIAQWQGIRIDRIKNFISSHNGQLDDLNMQLSALVWEAATYYGMPAAVNAASTPEQACAIWTSNFEGGNSDGQDQIHAREFYNELANSNKKKG